VQKERRKFGDSAYPRQNSQVSAALSKTKTKNKIKSTSMSDSKGQGVYASAVEKSKNSKEPSGRAEIQAGFGIWPLDLENICGMPGLPRLVHLEQTWRANRFYF